MISTEPGINEKHIEQKSTPEGNGNDNTQQTLDLPLPKPKKNIFRAARYNFLKLLRLKDAAYKIALPMAFACGLACIPTFGLGAIFVFIFAWALKVSKSAGVLMAVVVTPLTPVLYLLDALLAHALFNDQVSTSTAWQEAESMSGLGASAEQSLFSFDKILSLGANWFLASFIIAAVVFVVTYPIFHWLIKKFQKKRFSRIAKKNKKRTSI